MEKFLESEMVSPLIEACMDNDIDRVEKCLVSYPFNVNEVRDQRGRTSLHIAASRGNVELMKLLCHYGGDLSVKDNIGNTLLHMCNHINVLSFLAEQGLSPFERNINGDTPAVLAERFGASREVMEFLYQMEQYEMQDEPPKGCPILGSHSTELYPSHDKNYSNATDILSEFGPYKILVLLLVIAFLSLYITYYIIGELPLNSHVRTEIPQHSKK